LKTESIGCPKTSVRNYHFTLRNIQEERGSKKNQQSKIPKMYSTIRKMDGTLRISSGLECSVQSLVAIPAYMPLLPVTSPTPFALLRGMLPPSLMWSYRTVTLREVGQL
jgi:hypothetical protein